MNNDIKKCPGCGAEIQTMNPDIIGYIRPDVLEKRGNNFLCERCYRLLHYSEIKNIHTNDIEKNNKIDFEALFKEISQEENLIVNIIDSFDLLGSMINNINDLFPKSKILIIANKYDLFMRSNRPTKIRRYLKDYLKSKNIDFIDCIVTSSITDDASLPIYNSIFEYSKINKTKNLDVYFVGITNVGKSTLINTLSSLRKDSEQENEKLFLTTSNQVGTTRNISRFTLGALNIGDTPGYYNEKQLTYYLEKKSLNLVIPKKYIKPRVYQLYTNDTIFINGICYFTFLDSIDNRLGVSIYIANTLMTYRTKNNPDEYFDRHINDYLSVPNEKERQNLGKVVERNYDVEKDTELAISGVGFISFNKNAKIRLMVYEKIEIELRKAMI